jgi:hypothetical protein
MKLKQAHAPHMIANDENRTASPSLIMASEPDSRNSPTHIAVFRMLGRMASLLKIYRCRDKRKTDLFARAWRRDPGRGLLGIFIQTKE